MYSGILSIVALLLLDESDAALSPPATYRGIPSYRSDTRFGGLTADGVNFLCCVNYLSQERAECG